MELLALYLWLKLDAVRDLLAAGIAGLTFAAISFGFISLLDAGRLHRFVPWWAAIAGVLALLHVALPTTKDAAILAGAHFAIQAAGTPEGVKVQSLLRARVNEYLDAQLADAAKGSK